MYFKLKMKLGTLEHRHVDVYFKGRTIEKIELDLRDSSLSNKELLAKFNDPNVKKYLSGKLEFTTDVTCTKHESGKSHSCGGHCH